jgi:hypothetical protein
MTLPLRYTKIQDCIDLKKRGQSYPSYSCVDAPGGGQECEGTGVGGKYSSCEECLQNCSGDPGGKASNSLATTKQNMDSDSFFFGSTGGKIIFVLMILVGILILINLSLYFYRKYSDDVF